MELHKERKKTKIQRALERGSTLLAQRPVTKYNSILQLVRERRPLLTYSLTGRQPYFFLFYLTLLSSFLLLYSLSFLPYLLFVLAG